MPQAAIAVVTAIKVAGAYLATASAAAGAGTATLTQTLAVVAANVAVSAGVSVVSSALSPGVTSSSSNIDWTADPDAPMHFPAGRVGVAGQIVHSATFGDDKRYAGFIGVVASAGPIKAFVSSKFDETAVTFDGTGKANSTQYANVMWFVTQRGLQPTTSGLTTPAALGAAFPDWPANAYLSGKASYMLVLAENSKKSAYGGKVPSGVHTIEGLYGWDPAQDSTYPGGSGACRLNNPATWVYLTNPILWGLKWALGLWEGPTGKGAPQVDFQVGGIGAKLDGIDVQSFVEAAAVSTANSWTVAAWPSTDDDKAQVLDSFLQAGGAIYAEKAGKISCLHRAAPRASIATITGADTAGPIEIDTAASRLNRINALRPRYWSEDHAWQMVAIDEVTSSAWQIEDGQGVAVKRSRGVDYNYVSNAQQCAELAALQIAHTREGITGKIPLRPYMQGLDVGDCITLDEPDFVLDGLKCLILGVDDDTAGDVLNVSFVSETDGKYPFAYGQTPTTPPSPTLSVYDPTIVAAPGASAWALTAETFTDNGASVPALVVTGACENERADAVIFEFRPVGATDWSGAGIEAPSITRKEITGLTPGTAYEAAVSYRVRGTVGLQRVLTAVTSGDLISPSVSGLLEVTSSASSVVGFHAGAGVTTTPTVTLSVSGATGTVSVLWDNIGGELAAFATADTSLTTAFQMTIAAGAADRATFLATVTDSGTGQSRSISVGAAFVDNT